MEQESSVKIVKDSGDQNRWGIKKYLYRQDGQKNSLNTKIISWIMGFFILVGTSYSMLNETQNISSRSPIEFNEMPQSQENSITILSGSSEYSASKAKIIKKSGINRYSGSQVIERKITMNIPPGTIVKAQLITNSVQGLAKAKLLEPIKNGSEELLPANSIIIGQASGSDDKLIIQFTKVLATNGRNYNISGVACDISDQSIGIKGKTFSKYALLMAADAGLNLISGLSQSLPDKAKDSLLGKDADSSSNQMKKSLITDGTRSAIDGSQSFLNQYKNKKSTVEVDSGQEFFILFDGEM